MRRACFDCHTNETRWPLYARVAPGSWLLARDVHKGRNHLNFSKWANADEDERQTDRENAWERSYRARCPPGSTSCRCTPTRSFEADKALLKAYLIGKSQKGKETDKRPEK